MEIVSHEVEELYINHIFHDHQLNLCEEGHGECQMCYQKINGPSYGCASCKFHIHKSCGELPQEILHPFHLHYLKLKKCFSLFSAWRSCKVCSNSLKGSLLYYSCDAVNCKFYMHMECASLKPSIKYEGHNEHLLTLVDNVKTKNKCLACGHEIVSPICVRCVVCDITFDVQCGLVSLPETIVHEHHQHALKLTVNAVEDEYDIILYCELCNQVTIEQKYPFYSCTACDYNTHACCAVTGVQVEDMREKRRHFSHSKHFLTLFKNERNDGAVCFGCEKLIEGPVYVYGCDSCRFYLHKSCMDLPKQILHPFHRHKLILKKVQKNYWECRGCHKHCRGLMYSCYKCNFYLDIACASLQPSIKYEGHEHLLTLFDELYFIPKCVACNFACRDAPNLRCLICNFNVHLSCSLLPQTIVHKNHQHSLTLVYGTVEDGYPGELCCDVCKKKRGTQECIYYHCATCSFTVEFNCVISEVIRSLKGEFGDVELRTVNKSNIDKLIRKGLTIEDTSNSTKEEEKRIDNTWEELTEEDEGSQSEGGERDQEIKNYILHEHPLTLFENASKVTLCYGCGNVFSGKCSKCKFNPRRCFACGVGYAFPASYYICEQCWPNTPLFHQSCAELPHEIQISFHPHGSLHLVQKSNSYKMRNAKQLYKFCCEECSFEIDYGWVVMFKKYQEGQQYIEHPSHEHPMTLMDAGDMYYCELCNHNMTASPAYSCTTCSVYIHKSCFELPSPIRHPFHPFQDLVLELGSADKFKYCQACGPHDGQDCWYYCSLDNSLHTECAKLVPNIKYTAHEHPVTLIPFLRGEWMCNACGFDILDAPFLRCVECNLSFHVECEQNERATLKHFSHRHVLALYENEENDDKFCFGCVRSIQGQAYCCDFCRYYLHKSCAEHRRTINHRFHKHGLTLVHSFVSRECKACCRYLDGFMYGCDSCEFYLDLDCVSLLPSVVFKGHKHKLTIFEELYGNPRCKDNCILNSSNAFYLRCVNCNFSIHLWCCPLPQTIEHESHLHSLTLTNKLVDDAYDEVYCDICEEKRDGQECIYYCAECDFVAEFKCVISQVLFSLKEKRGEVLYRTIKKELITLENLLNSLTLEEAKKIKDIIEDIGKEMEDVTRTLSLTSAEFISTLSGKSSYSDETLLQLMVTLKFTEQEKISSMKFWDVDDEVVSFGDQHRISQNLDPVIKKLFEKHTDIIGANCTFSPDLMTAFLVRLCGVVQSMNNTRVFDITDELMFNWWHHLKIVQHGGFRIDFAFNQLKRIAHACYGFDIKSYENNALYKLYLENAQHTREMDELEAKLEECKKKIEEGKKKTEGVISNHHTERSIAEAKRVSETLDLRLKKAGDGLL